MIVGVAGRAFLPDTLFAKGQGLTARWSDVAVSNGLEWLWQMGLVMPVSAEGTGAVVHSFAYL